MDDEYVEVDNGKGKTIKIRGIKLEGYGDAWVAGTEDLGNSKLNTDEELATKLTDALNDTVVGTAQDEAPAAGEEETVGKAWHSAAGAARNRGWSSEQFGKVRFFGLTALLIALAFLVAVLIPDVEVVFGLTGCTFGIMICFVLPALMFLRASGEDTELKTFDTGADGGEWKKDRKMAIGVLVMGSLLGFASLIMTLASLGAEVEDQSESGLCNNTPPALSR